MPRLVVQRLSRIVSRCFSRQTSAYTRPLGLSALAASALFLSGATCTLAAQDASNRTAESDDQFADQLRDTEPGDPAQRLSGVQAAASISVDDGFAVSLFASEPELRQPIAMAGDRHGNLWVVENYTYAEASVNFDRELFDRILVLNDRDRDGRADERTVFWDEGKQVTSVEVGRGGVWILAAPQLLFIPDANEDLVPDGEPVVLLDGWDTGSVRHNIVNGLRWGPDGWLYGRHGILATSLVGVPGTPVESRTPINCGIWRYHPETRRFEVVSRGTTNPWGMDWTSDGELLFINTVIGHLWHALPNSHLERMYGNDFDPHLYSLMPQVADHIHWSVNEKWNDIRNGISGDTDAAGGGHAHSGFLIYQEGVFPSEYHNNLLAINLHGQRINRDFLEEKGISYNATHGPDTFQSKDPWFRGVELIAGPDGQVWIADWSDTGECHENDGVSRSSGRIYQWMSQSNSVERPQWPSDIEGLIRLAIDGRSYWSRQALQALAHEADLLSTEQRAQAMAYALKQVDTTQSADESVISTSVYRARALWAANACGPIPNEALVKLLGHSDPVVRRWSVRLLSDNNIDDPAVIAAFKSVAEHETNGLVLAHLASALVRLPHGPRLELATILARNELVVSDHRFAQLVWYGINHSVVDELSLALELVKQTPSAELKHWVFRRLASEFSQQPELATRLLEAVPATSPDASSLVLGMRDGTQGLARMQAPEGWTNWEAAYESPDKVTYLALTQLRALFGDGWSVDTLKQLATSGEVDLSVRSQALESLGQARSDAAVDFLIGRIVDRDSGAAAVGALRHSDRDDVPQAIIDRWEQMRPEARVVALGTLTSRAKSAAVLLDAVEQGKIDASAVGPYEWRQIAAFQSADLEARVAQLWPQAKLVFDDRLAKERLHGRLTEQLIGTGDFARGKEIFTRVCGNCHRLVGEGGRIGPDLTGSQRANLNYLIDNIATPSAEVATSFRTSIIELNDGQVIVGVIVKQLPDRIEVQTKDALQTIDVRNIEIMQESGRSLMPDALADALNDQELADLFKYLQEAGR